MMADLACARWMQRSLKYGRAFDLANVVIIHRSRTSSPQAMPAPSRTRSREG
jgi:hypothetical protein